LKGVTAHLSCKILKYSADFNGVLLSYSELTSLHKKGMIFDEQPHIHFDVTYIATVFRPLLGSVFCGTVNKISVDHVGCLLYDCFNVTVTSNRQFSSIQEQSNICFVVTSLDTTGDLLSLTGEWCDGALH
jgi:DNA-directed RNA polymerase subunit E'/Rpb7